MIIKKYIVYCHTNKINGKRYVGITSQKPEKRWGKNGDGYKGRTRFNAAIKKYGWEEFTHEILFTELTEKEAQDKEQYLIAKWHLTDKRYGYNMTAGGEHHSCYGRKLSKETKDRISKSHMGIRPTKETLLKLRDSHLNKGGRAVIMCDKNNNEICMFVTAAEACRILNIKTNHIGSCCRGIRKTAGGYKWKYA